MKILQAAQHGQKKTLAMSETEKHLLPTLKNRASLHSIFIF